ncbi:MAG: cytochrome C biogenesis protein [Gammaproteobacteria bacterium]|nr:cytochrome C biogenesis protein [Gammaproteobacteria bacterium]|tara:strand:- start:139882 stop:141657 length:1776 start_codon:yes stop_codon:yes gene_type:complete
MKQNKLLFTSIIISLFFVVFFHSEIIYSANKTLKNLESKNEFLHPDQAFIPSIELKNQNLIHISWDIEQGYYLYMGMFEFSTDNDDIQITKVVMPDGKKKQDEFFGDVDVYYNQTNAEIYISGKIDIPFTLIVTYQGCAEAGLCYPPVTKSFNISRRSDTGSFLKTGMASSDQIGISESLKQKSIFTNIILFLLAGILLAFTPCVFPMIPILTGLIIGQGQNISVRKSFFLTLTYVLSMSITYAILGIIIALFGSNIQASIQSPYVITLFAILFTILALAMFKIINLQMPSFIQTKLSESSNNLTAGSFYGVALMGSLSALIVGPCVTAPLLGALLYVASTNDYILGGLALFSLGFGMGIPLLILGTSATNLLKKIGPYLEIVNKIFGLLFIVVAIWLLERILSIHHAAYVWAVLPLLTLYVFRHEIMSYSKNISRIIATVLISYSFLLIYGANLNTNFTPYLSFIEKKKEIYFQEVSNTIDLKNKISSSKNITLVDLYADWCVACKELEKYTFRDQRVIIILNNLNLVKFDITNSNKDNADFLKKFNLFGPPALMFFSHDDGDIKEIKNLRTIGFIDAETFVSNYNNLTK